MLFRRASASKCRSMVRPYPFILLGSSLSLMIVLPYLFDSFQLQHRRRITQESLDFSMTDYAVSQH
jgi:hypothetical protein